MKVELSLWPRLCAFLGQPLLTGAEKMSAVWPCWEQWAQALRVTPGSLAQSRHELSTL